MKTICVFISFEGDGTFAVDRIENTFPCFVYRRNFSEDGMEVTIKCRQEDAPRVEKILAPFV